MSAAPGIVLVVGTILAPMQYVDCAAALLEDDRVTIHERDPRQLLRDCQSDRQWIPGQVGIWACLDFETWSVWIDRRLTGEARHQVLLHEAAHFCGWPSDHPGPWEVGRYEIELR